MISQIKDYGLSSLEQEIAEDILWNINERGYENSETKYLVAVLLYTSPSPRDGLLSRMPSSA